MREVEGHQAQLLVQRCAALAPAQPAGDHQVQHQVQLVPHVEHDALADARKALHLAPHGAGERRHCRAQQKRARHAHALERAAHELVLQALDVQADVGQLGHGV